MKKIRSIFILTAEISSLILIIGFILSVIVNQHVFSGWGLNFLQIASVNDVILGGLMFVIDLIEALVPFALGFLAFRTYGFNIFFYESEDENRLNWGILILLFMMLLALVFVRSSPIADVLTTIFSAYCAGFWVGWMVHILGRTRWTVFRREIAGHWMTLSKVSLSLFLLYFLGAALPRLIPDRWGNLNGSFVVSGLNNPILAAEKSLYLTNVRNERCRRLALLWSGERAMVVSCDEALFNKPETILVLYNPQQVMAGYRALHPDGPRPARTQYNCRWPSDRAACGGKDFGFGVTQTLPLSGNGKEAAKTKPGKMPAIKPPSSPSKE